MLKFNEYLERKLTSEMRTFRIGDQSKIVNLPRHLFTEVYIKERKGDPKFIDLMRIS